MITLNVIKKLLAKKYNMKDLGKVKTIIEWQVTKNTAACTMKIDQSAFIRDLIIEKRLNKCNANVIPMKTGLSLKMLEPNDYDKTDLHIYQQLIGKLIYLAYETRPDIVFVIGQLNRYNADPRKGHLRAVKKVVRYLKRIMQMGLIFG